MSDTKYYTDSVENKNSGKRKNTSISVISIYTFVCRNNVRLFILINTWLLLLFTVYYGRDMYNA